ncbi:MAG: NAD(P)-dependent alcohol dehydrogenase [Halieaceae bacterium]
MKVMTVAGPGGLGDLKLVERDEPTPAAGEVLVRWRATSLNYHDYLIALGGLPVPAGRCPMSDGAGEIAALGEGVEGWRVGDRVYSLFFPNWLSGRPTPENTGAVSGETIDGYACEYSCVGAHSLTRMPEGYSFEEAATLPCAALTAWRGLVEEGQMKAGDSVLIEGSGGMSVFGLQIAKAAGARVYATSSSEEKMARLKSLGADEVINYRTDENWGKTIAEMSGGGVDHVLDAGGDSTLGQSLEAVRMGGNISLIGVLGGFTANIMLPTAFFKHVSLHGIAVGSREMQQTMNAAIEVAGFKPVIDSQFPLTELSEAFEYQGRGAHFGKIVVTY